VHRESHGEHQQIWGRLGTFVCNKWASVSVIRLAWIIVSLQEVLAAAQSFCSGPSSFYSEGDCRRAVTEQQHQQHLWLRERKPDSAAAPESPPVAEEKTQELACVSHLGELPLVASA
jgi:hypothetical protein